MRFTLAAFTCALAVANAAGPFAKTDVAKRDAEAELTPFANTDIEKRDAEAELVHLEARTAIEEWAAGIQTAMYAVLYAAGLAQFLAVTIKNQSDQNSCAVVSGTADGATYMFKASTSGTNCDTTAEVKTLKNAVDRQLTWMANNNYDEACFIMQHGSGTWSGQLKISLNSAALASDSACNAADYISI